jgi:hypothetical protein
MYSRDKTRGFIQDIRFKNITVEGDYFPPSQILGFSETNNINNVLIENVVVQGTMPILQK